MRPLIALLATVLAGSVVAATPQERPEALAAHPLHVRYAASALEGTCTLVAVEPHDAGFALYFVTTARLFKTAQGDPFTRALDVRITMDDGSELEVPREYRYVPLGNVIDVAVLRVDVAANVQVAAAMNLSVPPPGRHLDVAAFDRSGTRHLEAQQVRFTSTRFIVGSRDLSALACLGAPAFDEDAMVGIVSECEPGRAPLMTPIAAAFPFLARQIPGLMARQTEREQP